MKRRHFIKQLLVIPLIIFKRCVCLANVLHTEKAPSSFQLSNSLTLNEFDRMNFGLKPWQMNIKAKACTGMTHRLAANDPVGKIKNSYGIPYSEVTFTGPTFGKHRNRNKGRS